MTAESVMISTVLACVGIWVLSIVLRFNQGTSRPEHSPSNVPSPNERDFDDFWFDIVGEASYKANIQRLAGNHGPNGPDGLHTATLVPEDDNPHDRNAVRVDIAGKTVGYIPRQSCKEMRVMLKKTSGDGRALTCPAVITGGFIMRDGKRAHYGVKIDLRDLLSPTS